MLDWSSAAVIGGIGTIVGFMGWIFRLGGRDRELRQQEEDIKELRTELGSLKQTRDKERELDRKERDMFQAAVNANLEVARTDHLKYRERAAETFATKVELAHAEARNDQNLERVVGRLDQISGRLETIGDQIIKTLAAR